MSKTLLRSRGAERLLMALMLIGVSTFAWARVRSADTRTLPYQGVLERDGVAVSGPVVARFGLFNAPNANTACVATNSCPLWSDEFDIDVVDGRFAVLLGEGSEPLTSAILSSPQLFLGVAFKTADDAAFTALTSTQEIIGAPIVQPGATPTVFTAEIRGPEVFTSSPPGWIDNSPVIDGSLFITHTLHTTGITTLICTATSGVGTPARIMDIANATPQQLVHRSLLPDGSSQFGRFFVICVGT